MITNITKVVFVAFSLLPILLIISIINLHHSLYSNAGWWLGLFTFLIFLCITALHYIKRKTGNCKLNMKSIKRKDDDLLVFLLVFLLPLISKDTVGYGENPSSRIILIAVICIFLYNAFKYNPILRIVGFNVYEFQLENKIPMTLISKRKIIKETDKTKALKISDYVYLEI